jgi:RimJ/RimL family protein N-acetyltransferase
MSEPSCLRKYETNAAFKNGLKVSFRPIQPADGALLEELFYSHSEQTIVHRYFAHIHYLSPAQVRKFVVLDYEKDFALVGLVPYENRERMICVGRYCRNPVGSDAEIAVTVHDDFQGRGIGTFLVQTLMKIAREHGITTFGASVMADNSAMMNVFHKVADKIETKLDSNIYEIRFELSDDERTKKVKVWRVRWRGKSARVK